MQFMRFGSKLTCTVRIKIWLKKLMAVEDVGNFCTAVVAPSAGFCLN
jgi:hypothetical protein